MLERAAYRDLLDFYYQSKGKLRSDSAGLFRICGAIMPDEQAAVLQVVSEFFHGGEFGYLKNARANIEIREQVSYFAQQSTNGKKGANSRWHGKGNGTANDDAIATLSPPQWPNHGQSHTHKQTTKPLRVVTDTAFSKFWETWPSTNRKVAKAKCAEIWKRRQLDPLAEQIIAHVSAMKETEQWREFSPSPLTYLNQRRWEDGITKPAVDQFAGAL